MTDIVPSIALGSPPETGASSMAMPAAARASCTSRDTSGAIDDMSTWTSPSWVPSMMPPGPSATSFTCGEFGSIVMTSSAASAAWAAFSTAVAPSDTRSSTASW